MPPKGTHRGVEVRCPNGHHLATYVYNPLKITFELSKADFQKMCKTEGKRCPQCKLSELHFVDKGFDAGYEHMTIAATRLMERHRQLGGGEHATRTILQQTGLDKEDGMALFGPRISMDTDDLRKVTKGAKAPHRVMEARCSNGHILGGCVYSSAAPDHVAKAEYIRDSPRLMREPCEFCGTGGKTLEAVAGEYVDAKMEATILKARHFRERATYAINVTQKTAR